MARIDRTKEAAQTVAEKLAGRNKPATTATSSTNTPTATDSRIAGLITLTPDLLPAQMPAFHPEKYQISDPLNPPESLPQATEAQLDKGMRIYEGATRALKLTGAALDVTREKFNVVGKHAKAFGAGIVAATEIEKVRGSYLDYLSQKEVTTQKSVVLDVNQQKTIIDTNISVFSKDELNQKLKQAELKSEELRLKTIETEGKLTSFKQQLGDYLEVSK
jgi:hypothetical protein